MVPPLPIQQVMADPSGNAASPLLGAFRGRKVSLATRHGKEIAVARPFRHALGVDLVVAQDFDTDTLGTFSGERARPADAPTTCLIKAQAGMAATGLTLGLASEGSFGPHPAIPLLPVGIEWMTFVDHHRGLVITERLLARRTNFSQRLVLPGDQLNAWLTQVGFPSHGLIVMPHLRVPEQAIANPLCFKGLRECGELREAIRLCSLASLDGMAQVETDMRAHRNPTRMAAIRQLAFRLARRLATPCPACEAPGWGQVDQLGGLHCGWCGQPTPLPRWEVFRCEACSHQHQRPRRDGMLRADPAHCPWCNP